MNTERPAPPGLAGVTERLAQSRVDVEAALSAVQLLGARQVPGHPDQVMGECGHPMSGQDWVKGWRVCERCPQESLFDMPEPSLGGTPSGAQP